jgi:predicted site-specific integrase-resolvase
MSGRLNCPEGCQAFHNVSQAAQLVGVSRRTLYHWMDGRKKANGRRTKKRLKYEEMDYGRAIRHDLLIAVAARMTIRGQRTVHTCSQNLSPTY